MFLPVEKSRDAIPKRIRKSTTEQVFKYSLKSETLIKVIFKPQMIHFKFLSCILYLVFLILFNILLGKVNKVKYCIIILYDQIVCCDLLDCCKQIFPNNSYLTPFFSFVTPNKGRQGLWVISARNINKTTFFYLLICQLNLQLSKF